MYHSLYDIAVLEELYALDALAGENNLFPCLGVEEVVAHVILVGVLVGAALDAHFVYLDAGVPGLVKDAAGLYVAELGAHESGAFAGFYMEKFYDEEVLAVDIEAHAVLEISCCCHKNGVYIIRLVKFRGYKVNENCSMAQKKHFGTEYWTAREGIFIF